MNAKYGRNERHSASTNSKIKTETTLLVASSWDPDFDSPTMHQVVKRHMPSNMSTREQLQPITKTCP
jgi:hypothetical protein